MISPKDRLFVITVSCSVIILVTIPYILAGFFSGEGFVFTGFLINPIDGNSYLAKMYQGWAGNWQFKLPFTAESGEGAYLNLFYLTLGHIARILQKPKILVYHIFRVIGTILLLGSLWKFYGKVFYTTRSRKFAFALASLGSGMGWLLLPTGSFTSDFWVSETFPFLSSYTNPHFPIGLSIILWLVNLPSQKLGLTIRCVLSAFGAFILSIISPFGIVIVFMILGGELLWKVFKKVVVRELFVQFLIIVLFGLPLLIYYLWVTITDPVFGGWNSQNLTPSPPVWDLILSLSPPLLFAILGVVKYRSISNHQRMSRIKTLIIWSVLGLLLVYLPIGLQRRFMMGLYVPLVGLATLGIEQLGHETKRYRLFSSFVLLLALPTNLIILTTSYVGVNTHNKNIYLIEEEHEILSWIEGNTEPDALILSSPEMGLFIPAYTGRRVIYGHPFETVNADEEELNTLSFFHGEWNDAQMWEFIENRGIDYIFYGPREKLIGNIHKFLGWEPGFKSGSVSIYEIENSNLP